MTIKAFHDKATGTLSYIVHDPKTKDCIIIDPVLNYDSEFKTTSNESLNDLLSYINSNNLIVHYILETHVHADHLSSSQSLKIKLPNAKTAINKNILTVQTTFKKELALSSEFQTDGRQFDILLEDQQSLIAGSIVIKILFTPGHTPACTSFVIENNIFSGDAIFMPDLGTGRCDFPGGSAKQLYNSITSRIYQLPEGYLVHPAHDYPKNRNLKFQASIKEQKENNIHLKNETQENEFIKFRTERDATLNPPRLIEPSLKVNLNGGDTEYL